MRAELVGCAVWLVSACAPAQDRAASHPTTESQSESSSAAEERDVIRHRERALAQAEQSLRARDFERAAQYYRQAIRLGAEERSLAPLVLRSYVNAKQYRLALAFGRDYLERTPGDDQARFLLATLLLALEEYEQAVEALEQVVHRAPNHAEAHYTLAVVLRDHRGDRVAADHHFRRYLAIAPQGPHAEVAKHSLLKSVP